MSLRILIVEDEAILALDLQELLEAAGHVVVGQAATMTAALKLAGKTRPDVVVMDMELRDGSNGLDAASELGRKYRLPALFVTARHDFLVRAMALDIEPLGYISKPYQPVEVLTALQQVA